MDRLPVDSSMIRSVGYDFPNSRLVVELHPSGRVYLYYDVPLSVYSELMAAESKGSYFNEAIRDLYPYEELEQPVGEIDGDGVRS
jgi:hypothetical protein